MQEKEEEESDFEPAKTRRKLMEIKLIGSVLFVSDDIAG